MQMTIYTQGPTVKKKVMPNLLAVFYYFSKGVSWGDHSVYDKHNWGITKTLLWSEYLGSNLLRVCNLNKLLK